jgi:hypothetical protein
MPGIVHCVECNREWKDASVVDCPLGIAHKIMAGRLPEADNGDTKECKEEEEGEEVVKVKIKRSSSCGEVGQRSSCPNFSPVVKIASKHFSTESSLEKIEAIDDIESEIQRDFDENGEKSDLHLGNSFRKNFPSFNPSTDFSHIVYDVKVNLQSRNRHNVVNSDQADQGYRFLVHRLKELAVRELEFSRRGGELDNEGLASPSPELGADDLCPIYVNIFARAFCGVDRVRIEVFDLIKADLDARPGKPEMQDDMTYETMYGCAKYAHKWLVSKSIVQNIPTLPDDVGTIDVKVVILGRMGVGKTSLLQRYREGVQPAFGIQSTIGENC